MSATPSGPPPGAPSANASLPKGAPLIGTPSTIRGIDAVDHVANLAPVIMLVAGEKVGKSSTVVSLFGFPEPHLQPLVIACDPTGPDSCLNLGYVVHRIALNVMPGARWFDKAKAALDVVEKNRAAILAQYGSLVVDDISTLSYRVLEDARRMSKNPDPRSHYQLMYQQVNEFYYRLVDFAAENKLPVIILGWAGDSFQNDQGITELATPDIAGKKFARVMAGRAHHVVILERHFIGVGQPGADRQGYGRRLHTAPWNGINAGGRLSHILPEPMACNLAEILWAARGEL